MDDHDVFVAAECSASVMRAVIEAALGAAFTPGQGADPVPVLVAGTTMVFFRDSHPFEDDLGLSCVPVPLLGQRP